MGFLYNNTLPSTQGDKYTTVQQFRFSKVYIFILKEILLFIKDELK